MAANTKPVTDNSFETDVLKAAGPVLVDFWAEWCGPCKMIGPILEEIAGEMQGQLTVAKMDLEENPMTPTKYGVRSIPTLILFKNGKPHATKIGAMPKQALQAWLKEQI
jgi:thioredoxin 1